MGGLIRGERNRAAYPIYDEQGRPGWQGVIVLEPDDYLWRCPHFHADHVNAVRCAQEQDGDDHALSESRASVCLSGDNQARQQPPRGTGWLRGEPSAHQGQAANREPTAPFGVAGIPARKGGRMPTTTSASYRYGEHAALSSSGAASVYLLPNEVADHA
jgi:hypothetical protein